MRVLVIIGILFSLVSCNDGDIEIPSFDFKTDVKSCGKFVLYRTNTSNNEALILKLSESEIKNEVGSHQVPISADNVMYRAFDGELPSIYFCADIPPVTPNVLRNWEGVPGDTNTIDIETTALFSDDATVTDPIGYEHTIVLNNLVLFSNDETITFSTYNFGKFSTDL